MIEFLRSIFFYGFILILILVLILYFNQNKLIYIPSLPDLPQRPEDNVKGFRNPTERNLDYENIEIMGTDKFKLRGWFIKNKNNYKEVPNIILFQGNAGNIGLRLPFLECYMKLVKTNIIVIGYRGYSNSEGSPSEKGLIQDGKDILNYLTTRNDLKGPIYLHGQSLGGAVAIQVLNNIVKGVILENTFTSMSDMVDIVMAPLKIIKPLVLANHWRTIDRINKVNQNFLFISSQNDEIVPFSQMDSLFQKCSAPYKHRYIVPQGDHNSAWAFQTQTYFQEIQSFLNR